jgi:hypothetical protein
MKIKINSFVTWLAALTLLAGMFAWGDTLPVGEDGTFSLTDDQKTRLSKADETGFSDADIDALIQGVNTELKQILKAQGDIAEFEAVRAQLERIGKNVNLTAEEIAEAAKANDPNGKVDQYVTATQLNALEAKIMAKDRQIEALLKKSVPEPNSQNGTMKTKLGHSSTHFLGTGMEFDAVDGRPWNAAALQGAITAGTDWGDSMNVERLQKDADHYFREDPNEIVSLHRDKDGLPTFWQTEYNVTDRTTRASIVTGEITQARKPGWLPKNKMAIKTEERKVFPVNVDIEWEGYDLQQMETSWLQGWNKEGSQAYKRSFIAFLLSEIDKQARLEDRKGAINGIYSPVPKSLKIPGNAIERMDGLLIQLWRAYYMDKKYQVAPIAPPTVANILDHEVDLIEANLKEEIKNDTGLVLYMSPSWMRARMDAVRIAYGMRNDYDGKEVYTIEKFPNIKLCALRDLEGSDFMFITYDNNISLLENRRGEKSLYHLDKLKRDFFIYADYKTGIGCIHIGNEVEPTDPASFKVQTVWTNGQPIFNKNRTVTIYDDTTGIVTVPFSNVTVMPDWKTDITTIKGQFTGQIIRITGSSQATKAVKNNAKIDLAGNVDFDLSKGGTLTLRVLENGNLKEISRTNEGRVNTTMYHEFTTSSFDSLKGSEFIYKGNGAATLAGILNPIENRIIKITAPDNGALTVTNVSGNVVVGANRVLNDAQDFVEFTVIDGVFVETNFNINA